MSKKLLLASELRTLRSASSGILADSVGTALVRSCHSLHDDGLLAWDGAHWTLTALGRSALEVTNASHDDAWLVDCAALRPTRETSATRVPLPTQNRLVGSQAVPGHA